MEFSITIFSILLLFLHSCYGNRKICNSNKELDMQCSLYCYEVVKPLLMHANEAHQKIADFEKLVEKIREQEIRLVEYKFMEKELAMYKSINATQSDLLLSYRNEIKTLSAGNVKTNKIHTTAKVEAYKEHHAIIGNDESSCLKHKNGVHNIEVKVNKKFAVPCDSKLAGDNNGWTVIQRRNDSSVSFERNWAEYSKGFGDLEGSFFIGLEKLYLLTNERPHELYISLTSENETRYAHYDHFQIGDDSEFYKIKSVGEYQGTAGDSLLSHDGMNFSTFDADHDTSQFNCATEWLSGWWFINCAYSNLNGVYQDDVHNKQNGIRWHSWDEHLRFTFVQMMIKPKN